MRIYFAMLLSLTLHAALIIAPNLPTPPRHAAPLTGIDARLIPQDPPEVAAEAVSTKPPQSASVAPPPIAPPRPLQGRELRRAQASLSEHLYYPPEAVARGLEGEVILLLVLGENGQLVSASVARSSGHLLLDGAALAAARRLGAMPGSPRQTLFPVNFRLN